NETSVFAAFDLVPSLLALARVQPPEGVTFDGEDVSLTLVGRSSDSRKSPIFWRRPPDRKFWPGQQGEPQPDLAVRQGDWKLLCDYDGTRAELYNLKVDRGETKNLAGEHPDV